MTIIIIIIILILTTTVLIIIIITIIIIIIESSPSSGIISSRSIIIITSIANTIMQHHHHHHHHHHYHHRHHVVNIIFTIVAVVLGNVEAEAEQTHTAGCCSTVAWPTTQDRATITTWAIPHSTWQRNTTTISIWSRMSVIVVCFYSGASATSTSPTISAATISPTDCYQHCHFHYGYCDYY